MKPYKSSCFISATEIFCSTLKHAHFCLWLEYLCTETRVKEDFIVSGFQSSNFLHSFISSYWMKHIHVKLDRHLELFFKFPYQWQYSFGSTQKQQWAILFIWKYLKRGERYDWCCQLATCCCITLKMAELTCRKLEMLWEVNSYQDCFQKVYGPTVSMCSPS